MGEKEEEWKEGETCAGAQLSLTEAERLQKKKQSSFSTSFKVIKSIQ